jgi:hypothetical protein
VNVITALVVGYVIGAKTGGKDLDRLGQSVKTLCETDEFADVVLAARAHVGSTLREVARAIDGGGTGPEPGGDLVATVRHLVGRE